MPIRRALLASVIALSAALGTSGCNFTSHVATMDYYAPSDGSQVDVGKLKARNLMFFQDGKGHFGFFGSFANSGPEKIAFAIQYKDASGNKGFREFTVKPYALLSLGYQGNKPLAIDLGGDPGDMKAIYIYTEAAQAEVNVPVMDDSLPQYRDLVASLATN